MLTEVVIHTYIYLCCFNLIRSFRTREPKLNCDPKAVVYLFYATSIYQLLPFVYSVGTYSGIRT